MTNLFFPKDKIKILLLEGISQNAVLSFKSNGYLSIEAQVGAMSEDELCEKIQDVHVIGIRSKTNISKKVVENAKKLLCVGCFCIGTNQVDLAATRQNGIPVFNAPFSNTRSVAELVIAQIINLIRGIGDKSNAAHKGIWIKSAKNSFEARGKNLGIIGYGHIGVQLSVLAEHLGMNVFYYDIEKKLGIGNAKVCNTLDELFSISDVVTLHVPETKETKNMITKAELSKMKKGSYIINASRGSVIVIDDLVEALNSGHILGAAIDVFPKEPKNNDEEFISPLRGLSNVILTPHIGGSTQEAQENIGTEVAEKLIKYVDNGGTLGAVNFAQISLPAQNNTNRILNIHKNIPGMMRAINDIFSSNDINITGQYLQTYEEIGYVITDTDVGKGDFDLLKKNIQSIDGSIKTRILY